MLEQSPKRPMASGSTPSQSSAPQLTNAQRQAAALQRLAPCFRLVLLFGLIGCLGVLAYHLRLWSRFATGPASLAVFYGLPLAACGWIVWSLRGTAARQARCALLLVSGGASLWLAEIVLTATDVHPWIREERVRQQACEACGQSFDTRSKQQVVLDLRSAGTQAMPAVHAHSFFTTNQTIPLGGQPAIPLGGVSQAVTVYCNEGGQYMIFQSDEHGFHNPPGLYQPGHVQLAVLGDSFAQGACVQSEENAVHHLRQKYPRTINLGNGGNGPLSNLATINEYVKPLRPQVVLWWHYEGNDLRDLEPERRTLLTRYLEEPDFTQSLYGQQTEIDRQLHKFVAAQLQQPPWQPPPKRLKDVVRLNQLRSRVEQWCQFGLADPVSEYEADYDYFTRILAAARQRVQQAEGRLVMVYLPVYARYADHSYPDRHRQRVLGIAKELGVPVIDVADAFQAQPDPLALFPFRLHGHYHPDGYRLLAQTILDQLPGIVGTISDETPPPAATPRVAEKPGL